MTTYAWSTPALNNGSVSDFRTWIQEVQAALAAVGMVQTTDTGQINSTTVTVPAINTAAGYEIWKLPGASPLFMKIEYGSAASATVAQMWITVGEGSNGAGTLTGNTSTRTNFMPGVNITSGATPVPSYMCATSNFFGFMFKIRAQNTNKPQGFCAFGKTVDNAGAGNNDGFGVFALTSTTTQGMYHVRRATPAYASAFTGSYVLMPGGPTATLYAGNTVAFPFWLGIPEMKLFPWMCNAILSEAPSESTFNLAFVSGVPRTYIQMGGNFLISATTNGIAMLWE